MHVTFEEMEQLLKEIKNAPGCTTSVEIDGDIYRTDWGYGEEAIEHFIEILKKRKRERMTDVCEKDTHEKLANDIYAWCATFPPWNHAEDFKNHVMEWLDREAALTEQECVKRLEGRADYMAYIYNQADTERKTLSKQVDTLHEKLEHSMLLPLDADGEPIHMGDILHSDEINIDFECKGLSIDMRGGHEHWTVCYQVTDGISDWTAAKRCHHRRSVDSKRRRYSDILESFAHSYNLFMFGSDPAIHEYSSKEELFDEYVAKLEEVVQ